MPDLSRSEASESKDVAVTELTQVRFKPGDVLRYVPARGTWARECTAVVLESGRAVDTYWHSYERDSMAHILSDAELESASFVFNTGDYDALDRYDKGARAKWLTFHPDDRGRISSQHNLQELLFIRKGATPDLETQIGNARSKVEDAESKLQMAQGTLDWARKELAKLEARRNA